MLIESEALGDLTKEEEILLEPKVGQEEEDLNSLYMPWRAVPPQNHQIDGASQQKAC